MNLGKAVAQKVRVKIRKPVSKLTVTKDSQVDNYNEFGVPGSPELVYEALRPTGRFRIVLYGSEAVSDQDLDVRDLEGAAKLALKSDTNVWSTVIESIWVLVPLLYIWFMARGLVRDHFEFAGRWNPTRVLKRKKPSLLLGRDWEAILEKATSSMVKGKWPETTDVLSWEIYQFLNSDRPKALTEDAWAKITTQVSTGLLLRLRTLAADRLGRGDISAIRHLVTVSKPMHVTEKDWDDLILDLSNVYVSAAMVAHTKKFEWSSLSTLAKALGDPRPSGLDEGSWKEYRRHIRTFYFAKLLENIRESDQPLEVVDAADLTLLEPAEARALRRLAYRRRMESIPDVTAPWGAEQFLSSGKEGFMNQEDYERLAKMAQTTKGQQRCSVLLDLITSVLAGLKLPSTAPLDISPEEWTEFRKIERDLVTVPLENQRRQAELTRLHVETSALKARILRQLDVVCAFLDDPSVLDRIEDYENIFAPGNLANLKKLSASISGRTGVSSANG